MSRNIFKRIKSVFICVFAVILVLLPAFTVNAALIEPDTAASLSITLAPDGQPLPGVSYSIYKVADVTADAKYLLLKKYDNAQMSTDINDITASNWRILATTLNGYVAHKGMLPDYTSVTNENGVADFSDISCGLYLVKGAPVLSGSEYIIPTPFIVSVPTGSNEELTYDVSTSGKYTTHPESENVYVEVLKVWRDDWDEERPIQVVVHLYNGNQFYDAVVLNKSNNWKFSWENLPMGDWSVYEQDIPAGYYVCVEQQVYRYVVANSSPTEDEPSTETTVPQETTTQFEETTIPVETTAPVETTVPQETTVPVETTVPSEVTTAPVEGTTNPPVRPPEIPNTGQLWWPVPVFAFAGLVFVMMGIIARKSEDE